jgi:hypothetical protein
VTASRRRRAQAFTLRDLIVLSAGFGAAMSVGVLMLVSSSLRGGTPPGWEAATEPAVDVWSVEVSRTPSAPSTRASTAAPRPTDGSAVAGSPSAPVKGPLVARPIADDGAAPVLVVATSPTVDTSQTPDPPAAEHAVDAPADAPAVAVEAVPAGDAPTVPAGLERQGVEASSVAADDHGWGSAVSEARHTDERGRDGVHAQANHADVRR